MLYCSATFGSLSMAPNQTIPSASARHHASPSLSPIAAHWAVMDLSRRVVGLLMDCAGWGPVTSPSRIAMRRAGLRLLALGEGAARRPVVLIVPAPIKRWYIWDLFPARSAVRRCLEAGVCVYLIDWARPTRQQQGWGLEQYADGFIAECVEVIAQETGQRRVFLAGHSLGGTLAAVFAALHPDRVAGLVLLEAPVKFATAEGALDRLVAMAPPAERITTLTGGNVPGSVLNAGAYLASPRSFGSERRADGLLSCLDPQALRTHVLVERWSLDESPMARRLCEQVVDELYREDRFMGGRLRVGGRVARPGHVTAPVLSVAERRSDVVPPGSILPFHDAIGSRDAQVLWYEGDVGVALQHVGPLVGRRAHEKLWPRITGWVVEYSSRTNSSLPRKMLHNRIGVSKPPWFAMAAGPLVRRRRETTTAGGRRP